MKYIIGIDQSTQGTKALLVDQTGKICQKAHVPHRQLINEKGWVSHDPMEIYKNVLCVARKVIEQAGISKKDVVTLGISNQRETTVAWNRTTGVAAENAIVWQCSRAKNITDVLLQQGVQDTVKNFTGIPLSPFYPAAKMSWLLKNNENVKCWAREGTLCLGTVDSWLVYCLTDKKYFFTDYSNASRTQLFNLHTLQWDELVCKLFGVPMNALPQVLDSNGNFGETTLGGYLEHAIPIHGVMGDSHGALFGHGCDQPGMAKVTYGTGSSVMMNIGSKFRESQAGLVTSLAWGLDGHVNYVLEGNINYTGAVITWLEKDLHLIEAAKESGELAKKANPADQCYLVPAFTGLGAPYWDNDAKALICGISRTTGIPELVKAGLDSIAYQIMDIVRIMRKESGIETTELHVDGGPTRNDYLMQFQSDLTELPILVPKAEELSALGVIYMAGNGISFFDVNPFCKAEHIFNPQMDKELRKQKYAAWQDAVAKTLTK